MAEPEVTTATIIPTPIVASTPGLAAALKAEPAIQQVLKQACGVEQAILSIKPANNWFGAISTSSRR